MKAPKYQRIDMLDAALQEASRTLDDPVEGLAVSDKGVVAWAGGRFIRMSYHWDNAYGENGEPVLGSGAWSALYVEDCDASALSYDVVSPAKPWAWLWRILRR